MAVKCEEVEKNLMKLTFEVSWERFEEGIDESFKKNQKKLTMPGFRKGKAPKALIMKHYGEEAFYSDAIDFVLQDAYEAAVSEAALDVVARPEIDMEDIKKGEPVIFYALVTTKPEIKLGRYKSIEVEKIENNVTDEDVEKEIDRARERNARIITVDDRAAQKGDIAVIDYEGFSEGVAFDGGKGENYELELGSNTFIPGFEDQIIGKNTGDEFDVEVTFPEEYHSKELAGKPAVFKVKLKEIKVKEIPEADDDFASEVSEYETLAEYKESVKKKLLEDAEKKTKQELENAVIEKLIDKVKVDIPEKMLEAEIDKQVNDLSANLSYQGMNLDLYLQYTGSDMAKLRESMRERAEKQIKVNLAMETIVEKEGIDANEEEKDQKIAEMAKAYNMEADKIKELLRPEDIEGIEREVKFSKALDLIVNKAKVKE